MADSKEVVAQGWLEKESKWLCRWNRRWVKLYDDGKLQTFTDNPSEVEAPSASFLSFLPSEGARMTMEVDILGAGVMGRSEMCFTFRARPKFCLEILTHTQRVHLGTNDLNEGQRWFTQLSAVALAVSPMNSRVTTPIGNPEVQPSNPGHLAPLEDAVRPSSMESEEDDLHLVDELESAVSPQASQASIKSEEHHVQTVEDAVRPSSMESEADELRLVDESESAISPQASIKSEPDEVGTSEGTVSPQSSMDGPKAVPPAVGQNKGKGAPPKGKGKGKAGPPPPPPSSPTTKGKGKGTPPQAKAKAKGKGAPKPSFRVSLSGLKHNVAAFGDLTLRDVQLKEEDWHHLDSLFKRTKEEVDVKKSNSRKTREIFIFNSSVHQAFGIFIKKKEMQEMQQLQKENQLPAGFISSVPNHLRNAILSLNAGIGQLSQEDLQLLLAHAADLQKLAEWVTTNEATSSGLTNLRDLEQKLLPAIQVPRYEQRLRVMLVMDTWNETREIIEMNTQNILNACYDFKTSEALRHLMGVTTLIYNRVMCGAQIQDDPKLQDDAGAEECFNFEAFDIKSFSQLKATKACFSKDDDKSKQPMSMLHFIVGILRKQSPERTWSKVEGEFKHVELAKNVDVGDLREVLKRLQGSLGIINRELAECRAECDTSSSSATPSQPADGPDSGSESDETCSPERRPPKGLPKSCLGKLHLVKGRLEEAIESSRREIQEAETAGIELLKYFGHQASGSKSSSPSNGSKDPEPGEVREFFKNWSDFLHRDFKASWQELDTKFKNAFGLPGRTPRTPRTPRSRASTNESSGQR